MITLVCIFGGNGAFDGTTVNGPADILDVSVSGEWRAVWNTEAAGGLFDPRAIIRDAIAAPDGRPLPPDDMMLATVSVGPNADGSPIAAAKHTPIDADLSADLSIPVDIAAGVWVDDVQACGPVVLYSGEVLRVAETGGSADTRTLAMTLIPLVDYRSWIDACCCGSPGPLAPPAV